MVLTDTIRIEAPFYDIRGKHDEQYNIVVPNGIELTLYAGFPGSPLNGGRPNALFGDVRANDPSSRRAIQQDFLEAIPVLNKQGIAVYMAYTNYFCDPEFLEDLEFSKSVQTLARTQPTNDLRNGIIVANHNTEKRVRELGEGEIDVALSCTAFFNKDMPEVSFFDSRRQLIDLEERARIYQKAAKKYDHVFLIPSDSHNLELQDLLKDKSDFSVLVNSRCGKECDSYNHYADDNVRNILLCADLSPTRRRDYEIFQENFKFRMHYCLGIDSTTLQRDTGNLLKQGFRNFKIGRMKSRWPMSGTKIGKEDLQTVLHAIEKWRRGK